VTRLDPHVRAATVSRLLELRAVGGLSSVEVRRTAAGLDVDERTVWRWLADGPREPARRGYQLGEREIAAFYAWRGNVAAARRALVRAGVTDLPSLATLQRAFAAQLTPGQRAAAVDGVEGRRRHEVYLRWAPDRRNALWEADHVELPVLVLAPRAQRPVKPWTTLFVEAFSRLIMGWAVSLRPHSGVVLAAMRAGIVVDPARGPFGGLPEAVRPDNGLEFAAAAIRRSCAALGIEHRPTPAYQGHSKGKVERVNRTLEQEFLSGLPFYTHGPRGADGALFGPDADPMGLGLFVDRFAEWVTAYNTTRVHSELGTTPLARWGEDATPLRTVDPTELRWMLMADAERTINKDGVHFEGVRFLAPELNGRVGELVQVRYTPHDLRQIEVFRGDEWLATAYPQDTLDDEQREAVLARRRADAAELGRRQRRASRRARAQLAPITEPGPVEDTTVVTAEDARTERAQRARGRRGDEGPDYAAMARLARTDLLGLKSDFAYWNPELRDPDPPVELDPAPDSDRAPDSQPAQDPAEDSDPLQDERRAGGEQGDH
jgi:putative transposase